MAACLLGVWKRLRAVLLIIAGCLQALMASEPRLKPIGTAVSGVMEPGSACFLPEGLSLDSLPLSLALVKPLKMEAALPKAWGLRPVFSAGDGHFRAHLGLPANVDLYGTGEVTGPLRRNGQRIVLWNTDNFAYERDGGRRLYQSHPWVLGVRADGTAFGVLFDSTWKAELDCREGITFTVQGPPCPVLVFEREHPQDVLKALGEWTGRMELPPLWALGYQQCRWSYEPDSRVREVAKTFRERKIPCDVLWMDIDYMDGFRIFTFDPKKFPNPAALNADLHRLGFHSVWMIDPGVKVDPAYSVFAEGEARKAWVNTAAGRPFHGKVWPGLCAFPDFTDPQVRAWWAGLYRPFLATGVDGVWNDMNEPAVFEGVDQTMPEDNRHQGGEGLLPGPHRQYHNVYGMLMARATREGILAARPDRRPFVLTRANFLGGQRYAATWTGDNTSREADLHLSIPMSLSLGLSGQPFNGPDLGGFIGKADGALWARWATVGAFFPFCRGHASKGTPDKEPWSFGPQVEATARLALQRRYRLLPYLYTCFEEASRTGIPVMRPLFFADPKDPALRREERAFLVGADLLVVPAWAQNAPKPKGTWVPLTLVEGEDKDPLQARLYLRAGAILPLGPMAQHASQSQEGPLELVICPDAQGHASGAVYQDAGDGFGYRSGDFRRSIYRSTGHRDSLTLRESEIEGRRSSRPYQTRILQAERSVGR